MVTRLIGVELADPRLPDGVTKASMPYFDVRAYGASPAASASANVTAINNAIAAAAAAGGGTVTFRSGNYHINGTITMLPYVSLRGDWLMYNSLTVTQRGTWLVWDGTGGTMLKIGDRLQTVYMTGVNIEKIGFDGQSDGTVTAISIGSNSRTSSAYYTSGVHIDKCILTKLGIGLQWGTGETGEQSDFIRFSQTDWIHCAIAGMRVNGTNCGDLSTLDTCKFIDCAAAGEPYIDLVKAGFLHFINCSGGGDGKWEKDWITVTNCNGIKLERCQAEGMRAMLRNTSSDYANSVHLDGCSIDAPIFLDGNNRVVSYATEVKELVSMTGAARWDGYGDVWTLGNGGRVELGASAYVTNRRTAPDTTTGYYIVGEMIGSRTTTNLFDYITRTGRDPAVWAAATAQTGALPSNWLPSTAYSVGDIIMATYGSRFKYICTTAGTTAATEPRFHRNGNMTDGTVVWAYNGGTAALTLVKPTVDNGHVYKLTTNGTTDATTEPSWPTTDSATVTDGTCVWQETGPATLKRPQSSVPSDVGSAPPTTGTYERGHIRYSNGVDPGEPPAWECTTAGTPGVWSAWAPMPRVNIKNSTPVTVGATDLVMLTRMGGGGSAVAVDLPATPLENVPYTIKDVRGDAAANNVTITPAAGLIDNAATYVIDQNWGFVSMVYADGRWNVVARSPGSPAAHAASHLAAGTDPLAALVITETTTVYETAATHTPWTTTRPATLLGCYFWIQGPGSGGGSGRRGAAGSVRGGGGGGAPGVVINEYVPAADLPSGTFSFTIAAAAAGGAAVTANDTNGNAGAIGPTLVVGPFTLFGSTGGGAGTTAGGAGGVALNNMYAGGTPAGAAGGVGTTPPAATASTQMSGTGGGGGAGITTAEAVTAGAAGGALASRSGWTRTALATGTAGAINGGGGGNGGTPVTTTERNGGTGGGGGGSDPTAAGGAGGNGGRGSGGGGGAASTNGANSGKGGDGGLACVMVTQIHVARP